jgi:simple sugar transport system permease protein
LQAPATLLTAVATGLVLCMAMAAAVGVGPLDLVETIWAGAWGSADAAINTITKVTPLLLTGLAVALAYKVGLLNIGCEGQLTLGALVSAAFARAAAPLPAFVLLPLTLLAGALSGALWAYPAVLLRKRRGVNEVISTLLLNYIAIYLCSYLVSGPLGDGTAMGRTPSIPPGAELSPMFQAGSLAVTSAPVLALLLSFAAYVLLSKTVWGFELRSIGINPEAALNAGIDVWKRRMLIFVLSGALAGLAGSLEVLAVHHRFYRSFSPGYGFDGLTAAFLVNGSPEWLWLSSLFLAGLRSADKWLQIGLNVSPNFILVVQAVLLLSVACQSRIRCVWSRRRSGAEAQKCLSDNELTR